MFEEQKRELIAIIDSGIGGISILREILRNYKGKDIIYFADNLYMPYGKCSKGFLYNRLNEIINILKNKYNATKIILACNTASSILDDNFSYIEKMKFNKDNTYLTTSLTKKSLPASYNIISDKKLASLIEQNIDDKRALIKIVKNCIKKHRLDELAELTLGCTHYELIYDIFAIYCPNTKIKKNSDTLIRGLKFKENVSEENNIYFITSRQSCSYLKKLNRLKDEI